MPFWKKRDLCTTLHVARRATHGRSLSQSAGISNLYEGEVRNTSEGARGAVSMPDHENKKGKKLLAEKKKGTRLGEAFSSSEKEKTPRKEEKKTVDISSLRRSGCLIGEV